MWFQHVGGFRGFRGVRVSKGCCFDGVALIWVQGFRLKMCQEFLPSGLIGPSFGFGAWFQGFVLSAAPEPCLKLLWEW